jgi:hypothetical protein
MNIFVNCELCTSNIGRGQSLKFESAGLLQARKDENLLNTMCG